MQEAKKEAWRGGRDGRYQRWAEWVQLMQYLDAKRQALTKANKKTADVLSAAAEVDRLRGDLTLTQFYKQVVWPWWQEESKSRAAERAAQKEQARAVGAGEADASDEEG